MKPNLSWAVLPLAAIFTAGLLWVAWQAQEKDAETIDIPDFSAFTDTREKKRAFFNFMLPKIRSANGRIIAEREKLLPILDRIDNGNPLKSSEHAWLGKLATRYRVKEDPITSADARLQLRKRVNTIPASLVLAQAANESAWGTARFARDGNNYFGLWCWARNCGLVPEKRDAEKKHEVARFDNIETGIRYYLFTLNSHPAYQTLREKRFAAVKRGTPAKGTTLAEGLLQYSERREAYVEEIQAMISFNRLQRFNRNAAEPD